MTLVSKFSSSRNNLIAVKIVLISVLLLFSFSGFSQNSCAEQIANAEKLYESGQIDKVAAMLEPCLEKGFSKDEKARAYRLLSLCNLYYNQDVEAEKNFLELLKVDKEYKIKDSDPSEFINLYQEFRTVPVFITGIKFGWGFTDIYNIENYNDINSVESNATYYEAYSSFRIGLSFETPIIRELSVVYEFYYRWYSYHFENVVLDYANVSFKETVGGVDIPLMLQWNILSNDFVPYVNIGTSLNFLISSKADYIRLDAEGTEYRAALTHEDPLDLTDSRNFFNYALCAGAGFRWKNIIGPGYLTFDIRYSRYMNSLVDPANRANNSEVLYSFLTTDNVFKVQNTQFLIGYKLPLFLPKHLGKAKK
jgi:hypothetical protein